MKRPSGSIPPLTLEGIYNLVGLKCAVAAKNKSGRRWSVKIKSVRYVNAKDALVVVGGGTMFGFNREVALSSLMWE
jgi:hypothetical protein